MVVSQRTWSLLEKFAEGKRFGTALGQTLFWTLFWNCKSVTVIDIFCVIWVFLQKLSVQPHISVYFWFLNWSKALTLILLSADVRTLDTFHKKCLRYLLGIRWYDRVWNDEVLQRTGLTSLSHVLSCRCSSLFGHVAPLDDDTPANTGPLQQITQPNPWPYVTLLTWSYTEQVAWPALKWFHPSDWRPLEACCWPWT